MLDHKRLKTIVRYIAHYPTIYCTPPLTAPHPRQSKSVSRNHSYWKTVHPPPTNTLFLSLLIPIGNDKSSFSVKIVLSFLSDIYYHWLIFHISTLNVFIHPSHLRRMDFL